LRDDAVVGVTASLVEGVPNRAAAKSASASMAENLGVYEGYRDTVKVDFKDDGLQASRMDVCQASVSAR
jgi:hypothetical protein